MVLEVGNDGGATQEVRECVEDDAVGHFLTFSWVIMTNQHF